MLFTLKGVVFMMFLRSIPLSIVTLDIVQNELNRRTPDF